MVINVKLFWRIAQRLDRKVVPGWWKRCIYLIFTSYVHISRFPTVLSILGLLLRSISSIPIFRSPSNLAPARIARWSTSIAQVTKSACRAGVVPPHARETHRKPGKNWFHLFLLKKNWLVVDLPLWKMMEFLSWDDDIPNIWSHKIPWFQSPPTRKWWVYVATKTKEIHLTDGVITNPGCTKPAICSRVSLVGLAVLAEEMPIGVNMFKWSPCKTAIIKFGHVKMSDGSQQSAEELRTSYPPAIKHVANNMCALWLCPPTGPTWLWVASAFFAFQNFRFTPK